MAREEVLAALDESMKRSATPFSVLLAYFSPHCALGTIQRKGSVRGSLEWGGPVFQTVVLVVAVFVSVCVCVTRA